MWILRLLPITFLALMSLVSLNLAIFNLPPIPIPDGAMILTLIIEMVMGRDLSLNVKETALKIGFVILMMVVVFVRLRITTLRAAC